MFRSACLAFWMLPRSGLRLRRNTSSCCCPAHRPRTHSRFTCGQPRARVRGRRQGGVRAGWVGHPHLDDAETEVAPVEHDDLVLVRGVIQDMSQGQQRGRVAEDGAAPGWVTLMRDDQPLLVGCDGIVQGGWLLILIWGCEVVLQGGQKGWGQWPQTWGGALPPTCPPYPGTPLPNLVKLEGHANPRRHHAVKQVHVSKDPLVAWGGDAEVPLEQGMQAVEEGLQAGRRAGR